MDSLFQKIMQAHDNDHIAKFGATQDVCDAALVSEDWGANYGHYQIGVHNRTYDDDKLAALQKRFDVLGLNVTVPSFPESKIPMPELMKAHCFTVRDAFDYRPVPKIQDLNVLNHSAYKTYAISYDPNTNESCCIFDGQRAKFEFIKIGNQAYGMIIDIDNHNENIEPEDAYFYFKADNNATVNALIHYHKETKGDFLIIVDEKSSETPVFWLPRTMFYQYYKALEQQKHINETVNKLFDMEMQLCDAEHAAASKAQHAQLQALGIAYRTAYKPVTSGYMESSWGDGVKANTVTHFVFDEAHGKQQKGDFLCTNPKGGWSPIFVSYDLVVAGITLAQIPYVITCKACLKKIEAMVKQASVA